MGPSGGVEWVPASACFPPHKITHPEKALQLFREFSTQGWDPSQPALVGYPWGEGIQLISGSHRWAAAAEAGIKIPVVIKPYHEVAWSWGHLERWIALMGQGADNGTRSE